MIKRLLVLISLLYCISAHAAKKDDAEKEQLNYIKQAQTLEKKKLFIPACNFYERATLLGYQGKQGQETNPKENKTFVQAALSASDCLTRTDYFDDPQKWLQGTIILFQLKNYYQVPDLTPRLTMIQNTMTKLSEPLKFVTNEQFTKPTPEIQLSCAAAEIGFKIGYLGEPSRIKDPNSNKQYVQNGIYHSACVALIPSDFKSSNPEAASLLSYSILKELANNYGSKQAKELSDPIDEMIEKARQEAIRAQKEQELKEQAALEAQKQQEALEEQQKLDHSLAPSSSTQPLN